jgi:hypothetical protein
MSEITNERYSQKKLEYETAYADYKILEASLAKQKYSLFDLQKKYANTESSCEASILSQAGKDYKVAEGDVDRALERASMAAFAMYRA